MTGNLPIHLERRTLPEQLRYLAGKLTDGTASPGVAALTLHVIADEYAEDGWDAARDRATEANDARRDERERILVSDETLHADGSIGPDAVPDGFPADPAYWYRRWLFAMKQLDAEAAERISAYVGMQERLDNVVAATARRDERERILRNARKMAAMCPGCDVFRAFIEDLEAGVDQP